MSFFSKNLEYLRKTKKMSLSELAEKINVNQSTISRWEREDMGVTVDNAYDISNFFNISIADLTGKDLTKDDTLYSQENENSLISQYKVLFDKDDKLTEEQKNFFLNFLEEKHKKIDENK